MYNTIHYIYTESLYNSNDMPSSCRGDSGGALAYMYDSHGGGDKENPQWRQKYYSSVRGVLSGGRPPTHCGSPGYYSYYTKVTHFRACINGAIVRLYKSNVVQIKR